MTGDSRLVELFLELARLDGRSGREKPVAEYLVRFLRRLGLSAAAGFGPADRNTARHRAPPITATLIATNAAVFETRGEANISSTP